MDYLQTELVTVIIPAFNCAKYLRNAVNSVLNQSYKNFELIIVDDGSTDYTSTLVDDISISDKRIHVFHKANGGLSDARNFGIGKACGSYICFLDADDTYQTNFIEELLSLCLKYEVNMAACGYLSVFPDGKIVKSNIYKKECCVEKIEAIKQFAKNDKFTAHAWAKMYKREIFDKIRYPKGKYYEDIFVLPDILNLCSRVAFSNKHLINYSQIPTSITHIINLNYEYDAFCATYKKLMLYKDISGLYDFLVKEPIMIALRIKLHTKKNTHDLNSSQLAEVTTFLKNKKKEWRSYRKLSLKFKIALLLSDLI